MSLRIILALAVISGVSGDNNATTAPQTDAADGLAPPYSILESAEKTQPPGEVRAGLEGESAGCRTRMQTTLEKRRLVQKKLGSLLQLLFLICTKARVNLWFPHRLQLR